MRPDGVSVYVLEVPEYVLSEFAGPDVTIIWTITHVHDSTDYPLTRRSFPRFPLMDGYGFLR